MIALWTENLIDFSELARKVNMKPNRFLRYHHPKYRYRIEKKPFLNERVRFALYTHWQLVDEALQDKGITKKHMCIIHKHGLFRWRNVGKKLRLNNNTFHRYYYERGHAHIQYNEKLKSDVEAILRTHKILLEWVLGLD